MIYTVCSTKGGVAKTATCAALTQAAAHRGETVLAIDLDPQGNLSFALSADSNKPGSYELIQGKSATELIQNGNGFDIIPAGRGLATLTSGTGTARRLQKALVPIKKNYRFIIIDTPPTAGELQFNALQAADRLIIPLQADPYSVQSLYQIVDTARRFQKSNHELQIAGIILTQYDGRSLIARQMKQTIEQHAAKMNIPVLAEIRNAVAVKESAALQESLYKYAPKSKPAADYMKLYEILTEQ